MRPTHRLIQSIGVNAEAIDVPQRSRDSAWPKQVHQSMDALGVVLVKVPKHGVIRTIGLRVPLVAAVHGRELDRVPDEEDGKVIKDKVLDTLLGIELCCPAAHIANGVAGPFFAADCRDASEELGFLADASEEICIGEVRYILEDFKLAKGTGSLCVHAPVLKSSEL